MDDLLLLIGDTAKEKDARSATTQKDKELQSDAASQYREACMQGRVSQGDLVDLSTLSTATVREKQAQRWDKYGPYYYPSLFCTLIQLYSGDPVVMPPHMVRKRIHSRRHWLHHLQNAVEVWVQQ